MNDAFTPLCGLAETHGEVMASYVDKEDGTLIKPHLS